MKRLRFGAWLALCALSCGLGWTAGAVAQDGTPSEGSPPPFPMAAAAPVPNGPPLELESVPASSQRNGREIYEDFRAGLADPSCDAAATSVRWKKHFGHAPGQLAKVNDDLLPLFGYVVDALRQADLPTEFALIPFVESGYKPGARSASGPAGLWQFIGITARNHGVAMRAGYDGRLSPVDSTQAAVRYLKTLHGMFGGDWRLAVMGYNAGEYRILQSMRRGGMNAQNARPAELPGLSGITYAYVEKLHALACIFQQADDREEWLKTLDRPVPLLASHALPTDVASLDAWASRQGHDPALLRRLNPALAAGLSRGSHVRVSLGGIDLMSLDVNGSVTQRLEDAIASPPAEDDDEDAAAGPIALAVDVRIRGVVSSGEDPVDEGHQGAVQAGVGRRFDERFVFA